MKLQKIIIGILLLISFVKSYSQPYVDIFSFNYQTFSSNYKDIPASKNKTSLYTLNAFLPKELKNGNVLLFRINTETIHSEILSNQKYSSNLSSLSLPIGFQWSFKNRNWKTTVVGIPKIASDFKGGIHHKDWQYGLVLLENYKLNPAIEFKIGLYYNREAFGNFFVPLVGVDWKLSDRIYCYGLLPTNYRIEYNIIKSKLYTGLNFKALTRSFNLSNENEDYVRFDEQVLKVFTEYHITKSIVFNGEVGYSFGQNPLQYQGNDLISPEINPNYTPLNKYLIFNIGIFYRIRKD